ncbi:MAG: 2-methylcitrate dehydratase, partial [Chloroflexota bacterium]
AFLARRGITGPLAVFEGNKGFMEAIAGRFEIDWSQEDLERVTRTILKRYNAEIHSQSALEAIAELKAAHGIHAEDIDRIEVEIFDVAYRIIGGGEEGDKTIVRTKEEADHSLPYLLAVMLLDGEVMPEQYLPERILRDDVQRLLRRVVVRPQAEFSRRFPAEMPCRVTLWLKDGRQLVREQADYEGFHTRPMPWETIVAKFERLSAPYTDPALRDELIAAVQNLEDLQAPDLTALLARVRAPG